AGIGAGLIRGRHAPKRSDLEAFLGLQLLVGLILVAGTAPVAIQFGQVGLVTLLMVLSLPVVAFRGPGAIVFERELRYRPLVVIELIETAAYYTWAVGT